MLSFDVLRLLGVFCAMVVLLRPVTAFARKSDLRFGRVLHKIIRAMIDGGGAFARDGPLAPSPQSRPYSCIHSVTGSSHMKISAAVLGLGLSVSFGFPAAFAGDLPDLAGKEITIVTENAYPPLQFID